MYWCICIYIYICIYKGGHKKTLEFIYKKLCAYSYMFKLQSPSMYSPFDATHLWDVFSTAQNSFWTHQFWCLLVLLTFFVSPLPLGKTFPFKDFFHLGKHKKDKKVTWVKIQWIGRVGHGGRAIFGQKLLNTQHGVGRWARKSPLQNWENTLTECSRQIHWSWKQPITPMPAGILIQMGS